MNFEVYCGKYGSVLAQLRASEAIQHSSKVNFNKGIVKVRLYWSICFVHTTILVVNTITWWSKEQTFLTNLLFSKWYFTRKKIFLFAFVHQ